jgi:hypothetical protein
VSDFSNLSKVKIFVPPKKYEGTYTVQYCTLFKKEKKIFLIYKEIQKGSGAKLYMYEEGLPTYTVLYMRKCANI